MLRLRALPKRHFRLYLLPLARAPFYRGAERGVLVSYTVKRVVKG